LQNKLETFAKQNAAYNENLTFFTLLMVRNFIVVFALSTYSLTTILFPAAMGFAGFVSKAN
jgi:ATP adenylyltransferase/5',5'''-P-1,P-4-tetraphosphate phosphorylase II